MNKAQALKGEEDMTWEALDQIRAGVIEVEAVMDHQKAELARCDEEIMRLKGQIATLRRHGGKLMAPARPIGVPVLSNLYIFPKQLLDSVCEHARQCGGERVKLLPPLLSGKHRIFRDDPGMTEINCAQIEDFLATYRVEPDAMLAIDVEGPYDREKYGPPWMERLRSDDEDQWRTAMDLFRRIFREIRKIAPGLRLSAWGLATLYRGHRNSPADVRRDGLVPAGRVPLLR
jgi:hypothetical protein